MGVNQNSEYLLDTHVLLWWFAGDKRLSHTVRLIISNRENQIFVSVASIWEMSIKYRLGKLSNAEILILGIADYLEEQDFEILSIDVSDSTRAGLLQEIHNDPFDRMLIAQAQNRNMILLSNEKIFRQYDIRALW